MNPGKTKSKNGKQFRKGSGSKRHREIIGGRQSSETHKHSKKAEVIEGIGAWEGHEREGGRPPVFLGPAVGQKTTV